MPTEDFKGNIVDSYYLKQSWKISDFKIWGCNHPLEIGAEHISVPTQTRILGDHEMFIISIFKFFLNKNTQAKILKVQSANEKKMKRNKFSSNQPLTATTTINEKEWTTKALTENICYRFADLEHSRIFNEVAATGVTFKPEQFI